MSSGVHVSLGFDVGYRDIGMISPKIRKSSQRKIICAITVTILEGFYPKKVYIIQGKGIVNVLESFGSHRLCGGGVGF